MISPLDETRLILKAVQNTYPVWLMSPGVRAECPFILVLKDESGEAFVVATANGPHVFECGAIHHGRLWEENGALVTCVTEDLNYTGQQTLPGYLYFDRNAHQSMRHNANGDSPGEQVAQYFDKQDEAAALVRVEFVRKDTRTPEGKRLTRWRARWPKT